MPIEDSKAYEIKRLTTPLKFKDSKAYDIDDNIIHCVETLYDVRYIIEPKDDVLTDDEILKYAPNSKMASEVKLKRGNGNLSDALLVHESVPWILGLYYMILICISIPLFYGGNKYIMLVILILFIIPLIYMYRVFNLNSYIAKTTKTSKKQVRSDKKESVNEAPYDFHSVESLKSFEKEINNLKILFEVKEEVVRELIEKRFTPPQLTYDKFISMIDKSHELFYNQSEKATDIIQLAAEDTPRVRGEIQSKIQSMEMIINQIEELINELVININNEDDDSDVKNLLDDMENIIDSVKDY